ncbi:Retrovirus-related Pol polyprotein, partial [Mucuna pruriens]
MTATIQDLKTRIGQLANIVSQLQLARSSNLPSQTIPNPRGNASVVTLRSGKELPQPTLEQVPRSKEADSEPNADLQSRPETTVPLPFPSRTTSARKLESDEELLKMFQKVEINIPFLDAIKHVPKYAKFLKELCEKDKGEQGKWRRGVSLDQKLGIHYRNPKIFSVPCTIGEFTFADAMLDLGASINVMPASIYRSLNFGDLESTRMTIQLVNRSIVQPLGVLVQVNELIFLADFYVLDMEDKTSGKESTLIMGRPFLMTTRTKIDVHVGTLSMEFGDTMVQFNIFEAMKHPTEDHSLFGIDVIEELVEEYFQLSNNGEDMEAFVGSTNKIRCLWSVDEEIDHKEVQNLPNPENNHSDIVDLDFEVELSELLHQVCNQEHLECTNDAEVKVAETKSDKKSLPAHQTDSNLSTEKSPSSPPPMELKPLLSHLKYAYLDKEQQLPVILANNLHQEQEDKLLEVLRQHKRAIGWKLSDLPGINPSIYMHRILMEEEVKPIRQQQRRLNLTLLDVVKKEVTKLLAAGIIYPISDSQWVSPVQVVPKKSRMTIAKNQHDELVPTRIQNSWRVCIDYRRLNQATRKDHFPLPFIDQATCKYTSHRRISIRPPSPTHLVPLRIHACHLACATHRAHSNDCMKVFMDDFTMYADSFEACLSNLSKVLKRCVDTNLMLNFEKCHFMVTEGIVLGHLVCNRGIEVDKSKIDIITSLPNPTSVREVHSFLGHAGFKRRFIKNFSKLALPLSELL